MGRGSAPPMAGNGPVVRGSSVQGFPCRYYDWRVLDEHCEGGRLAGRSPGRWRFRRGTDGIKKRRTGGLRIAFLFYKDALRRPPVFPACKQWPDSEEGVARGKYTRFFETKRNQEFASRTCGIRFCLKGAMPERASSSARSFSGWPACPLTQCQTTL